MSPELSWWVSRAGWLLGLLALCLAIPALLGEKRLASLVAKTYGLVKLLSVVLLIAGPLGAVVLLGFVLGDRLRIVPLVLGTVLAFPIWRFAEHLSHRWTGWPSRPGFRIDVRPSAAVAGLLLLVVLGWTLAVKARLWPVVLMNFFGPLVFLLLGVLLISALLRVPLLIADLVLDRLRKHANLRRTLLFAGFFLLLLCYAFQLIARS